MRNIEQAFDDIIPEQIIDCQFEEMTFTSQMLDIYFSIDGSRSLAEIHKHLSINAPEIISDIKKLAKVGIIRVRKKKKNPMSHQD